MERVRILAGEYKGLTGDGYFIPSERLYRVAIPFKERPEITEFYPPESVKVVWQARRRPILEKREDTTLRTHEDVQIIGCKGACGSVWCKSCFVRRGGSRRFAKRLAEMDFKAVRQVVLTVDLKKFDGSGQIAFETLKSKEAVSQFIHNLVRTGKIDVKDWVWILEWHRDGAPHYHVFIETQRGREGRIGNKALLNHWKHGLVFESYIKSELHWRRFTDYFSANGYFDPKMGGDKKDKGHQLELPEWAMGVTYRIRKTGGMIKKRPKEKTDSEKEGNEKEKCLAEEGGLIEEAEGEGGKEKEPKTYKELLGECGRTTYCLIRRGKANTHWRRIKIPYSCFTQYAGEYLEGVGYVVQMDEAAYFLFMELYSDDLPDYSQDGDEHETGHQLGD